MIQYYLLAAYIIFDFILFSYPTRRIPFYLQPVCSRILSSLIRDSFNFAELDKQPSKVYEASYHAAEHLLQEPSEKCHRRGVQELLAIENTDNPFVPTIGRWGSEWPS